MRRWLRLWFSWRDRVDRRTYLLHGAGEFRLTALPGQRTRLEGRTRYEVEMFPQSYWTLPAGRIVAAIHARVLRHIKTIVETDRD